MLETFRFKNLHDGHVNLIPKDLFATLYLDLTDLPSPLWPYPALGLSGVRHLYWHNEYDVTDRFMIAVALRLPNIESVTLTIEGE